MSAKSLQRRWKHEIQIALLRLRVVKTRAVLPNPFGTGALHHWGHVPALDGRPGDHDHADSETDTAIPDGDDDIASLASQASSCARLPSQGSLFLLFRCFQVSLSLTLSSKITKCLGCSLTTCSHLSGRPTGGAFQRNLLSLSQLCRGSTGENALASYVSLRPPLISRPTVPSFLFSSWTLLTDGSEREDNDIHIFDSSTLAHWQVSKRQSQDSSPDASPITHRCCTQCGQFSKLSLRSIASWKSSTTSLQVIRQQHG